MRLRHLNIKLQTTDGPYGASIGFPDGLVIVWADNSMGKSTCVKAALVALGLESMLTTTMSELPLTPALLSDLKGPGSIEAKVIESDVLLEIENKQGQRVTVHRTLKGNRERNLITVYHGPALTSKGNYRAEDFFVNLRFSAKNEKGFHRFLADFIGWELPQVLTFDDRDTPLYLQCLFPFFVVEQTRGWSTVTPPLPTQFRIRDLHKRCVEFILNLDARSIALKRQELAQRKAENEKAWELLWNRFQDEARNISAQVVGVPRRPTSTWPPQIEPALLVALDEGQTQSISEYLQALNLKLVSLVDEQIPRAKEVTSIVSADLATAEEALAKTQAFILRSEESLRMEAAEVDSIESRLQVIDEDIRRNQDAATLSKLGSKIPLSINTGECPVCHQHIADSLIPPVDQQQVMSLDVNIEFLKDQRKTFQSILDKSQVQVSRRRDRVKVSHARLDELRSQIRSLRETLIVDGRMPSVAAVRERLLLEDKVENIQKAQYSFAKKVEEMASLSTGWEDIQKSLSALPASDASDLDYQKISQWSSTFRELLMQFDFQSLNTDGVTISNDQYRPEFDGFDLQSTFSLQNSISASDLIRTIWSFLLGLMEVSRNASNNHPGMLIFDEPRQQSAKDLSFRELLVRASTAGVHKQQVIIFTSEKIANLKEQLKGIPHTLKAFEGHVIHKSP